jgi:hypothetical protein
MKKILTLLLSLLAFHGMHAQTLFTSPVNPSCNGQCNGAIGISWATGTPPFLVNIDGGSNCPTPPATYTTSQNGYGATNLCACVYTISVVDGTGSTIGTATVQLVDPPALTVSVTSFTNPSCGNCSDGAACASAGGGSGVYTYTWMPASTSQCITNVPAGSYTVCAGDANGCVTCTVVTLVSTSVQQGQISPALRVFPNPAADMIYIDGAAAADLAELALFDVLGNLALRSAHVTSVSVADLPPGLYELRITGSAGVLRRKVMVAR